MGCKFSHDTIVNTNKVPHTPTNTFSASIENWEKGSLTDEQKIDPCRKINLSKICNLMDTSVIFLNFLRMSTNSVDIHYL